VNHIGMIILKDLTHPRASLDHAGIFACLKNRMSVLSLAVIFICLMTLFFLLLSGRSSDVFFNDEGIVTNYFVWDLFFSPYNAKYLNLSYNPYFFPDVVLYLIAYVFKNIEYRFAAYSTLLLASVGIAFAEICLVLRPAKRLTAYCFSFITILCLVIAFSGTSLLNYAVYPGFHGGSLLNGLLILWLLLRAYRSPGDMAILIGLVLLLVVSVYSDGVVLYSFVIPLFLCLMFWLVLGLVVPRTGTRLMLTLLTGSLLGFTLRDVTNALGIFHINTKMPLSGNYFLSKITAFLSVQFRQFLDGGVSLQVLAGGFVLVIALLLMGFIKSFTVRKSSADQAAGVQVLAFTFPFFSIFFSWAFYVLFVETEIMLYRNTFLTIIPFLWVFLCLYNARLLGGVLKGITLAVILAILVMTRFDALGFGYKNYFSSHREFFESFSAIAKEEKLVYGLSRFQAKLFTLFNTAGVFVNQITPEFGPYYYADNVQWYFLDEKRGFPCYNFIIYKDDEEDAVVSKFGKARIVRNLDNYRVGVYDRPEDIAFRNVLKGYLQETANNQTFTSLPIIKELRHVIPVGTLCTMNTAVYLFPKYGLVIPFAPVMGRNVLEISLAENKSYIISYLGKGDAVLAQSSVDKMGDKAMLQTHYLLLPSAAAQAPVFGVHLQTTSGDGGYLVGHAFLHSDRYAK
jgi:hypothetical protein